MPIAKNMKAETEREHFLEKSTRNIIIFIVVLYGIIVLFYCYDYIMVICRACADIGFRNSSHGLSAAAFLWIISSCSTLVPHSPMFSSLYSHNF